MSLFTNSDAAMARTRNLSAFFTTRMLAEQARIDAVQAGLSIEAAKITDGLGTVTGEAVVAPSVGGLLETLKSAFGSDVPGASDEPRPSGFVLTAHVPEDLYDAVLAILERTGTVAEAAS